MKVYLVADSAGFRERLLDLLADLDGVELVGYAAGATEAVAAIVACQPDLVLLDLELAEGNGLQLLHEVKAIPFLRVAVVTNLPEPPYRKACLQAGADCFLDKATVFDELVALVSTLLAEARAR